MRSLVEEDRKGRVSLSCERYLAQEQAVVHIWKAVKVRKSRVHKRRDKVRDLTSAYKSGMVKNEDIHGADLHRAPPRPDVSG